MITDKCINLNDGIYCIDARYICPGNACCYLIVEDNEIAIIETGTAFTAEGIDEALYSLGLRKEMVRYIIPTHVHLDHAGGAGVLMQKYTDAQLVIHPRGARHMVNPDKLIAGSKAVYGNRKFRELYGEVVPVPEHRTITMKDKDKLYLKKRILEFRHTPGHADHHFCIWDQVSHGWFSGDTFGISYEQIGDKLNRFIFPTTSPVQFDPDKLLRSIDLIMEYKPKQIFLTHYSVIKEPAKKAKILREQIESYREIANELRFSSNREEEIFTAIKVMTLSNIASKFPCHDIKMVEELLELDFKLNAQGIDIWISKQNEKN
tara:strand:- start:53 stop:1009 length:957 start_codon:yes stop_codon:yes gene_type:complete